MRYFFLTCSSALVLSIGIVLWFLTLNGTLGAWLIGLGGLQMLLLFSRD